MGREFYERLGFVAENPDEMIVTRTTEVAKGRVWNEQIPLTLGSLECRVKDEERGRKKSSASTTEIRMHRISLDALNLRCQKGTQVKMSKKQLRSGWGEWSSNAKRDYKYIR